MESFPDVRILKAQAREQFTILLGNFYGKKDLVIDPSLMTVLDRITGLQFLKEKGVDKVYKLEHKEILGGGNKRVYIVRPSVKAMRHIAAHIHSDRRAEKMRAYKIFMVPRCLHVCESILEQEGVFGPNLIEDLNIGFIPLDQDIISLENPALLNSVFMEGDFTWLHTVAHSIVGLQTTFGTIPNVYGQGHAAKIVESLTNTLTSELGEKKSPLQHQIGHLVVLDRDVDYVTPLCSQVTYEGLLDDIFEIKCGVVDFGPEVTKTEKSVKTMLNSEDSLFSEIRDRHFTNVFPYLSARAKEIQANYDKSHSMELKDLKTFVSSELKGLKQEHRSLTLHIGASEVIMKHKTKGSLRRGDLQDILHIEHSLLEGSDFRECVNYIEECIHRQYDMLLTLRLLCLLSCTTSGLLPKDYNNLKHKFLHSYGFEHMLTFFNLKKAGLLTEAQTGKDTSIESNLNKLADSRTVGSAVSYVTSSLAALQKKDWFRTVSKKLSLIPKPGTEYNLKKPSDMAYVFGGAYTPLTCRLVEQAIQRQGWGGLEDVLRHLPGSNFEKLEARSAKAGKSASSGEQASKVALVYFIGGVTYSEVAALRFLAKQKGYRILIATTAIINGNRMLSSFVETVR
uniref:Vacuolar protein sorting-associated protein 33B n=1 Tax=Phallusia mammillata TaxID=59560 RepID=A0A6F9DXD9_9ASCI|nr:vacuolar protein sorting-associated protein 33B [Phallusia mammillata]